MTVPAVGQTGCCPQEEAPLSIPDRLFKIVLVGNSAVGKTSFLRRFCEDRFAPGLAATVGEFSEGPPLGREGVGKEPRKGLGAQWEWPWGQAGRSPCLLFPSEAEGARSSLPPTLCQTPSSSHTE